MNDLRFRKNENLILTIFVSEYKNDITVKKIARRAGLSRSTIYAHHHAVKEILPDYERYVLVEYSGLAQKRLWRRNAQLRAIFLDMLVFILRNKKIFEMFLEFNDRAIFYKMIGKIQGKIIRSMRLPRNCDKILKIYESEIAEVIFEWGKRGFSEKELEKVLSDIMYLTSTCKNRLMPIGQ